MAIFTEERQMSEPDNDASDATKQRAGKSYFSLTARCAIVLAGFGRAGIDTFEQERT